MIVILRQTAWFSTSKVCSWLVKSAIRSMLVRCVSVVLQDDSPLRWFDLGRQLRRGDFDHTLITPEGSVGVIARKGSSCLHVESASYDYIGPDRTARFG